MSSLFNQHRPSLVDIDVGSLSNRLPINYIKRCISGVSPHPNAIYICGSPGVGKSLLANLYARGTLCLHREEGSYEACGHCNVCKGIDNTNIHYHLVRDSTTTKEALEELIQYSETKPLYREGCSEHNNRRFIIIDEAELIHPTTMACLLNPLEYGPDSTTWILISMQPDKLSPIVREAIESRCKQLILHPFSKAYISNYIRGEVDDELADIIAGMSNGNMRRAWSLIELIRGSGATTYEAFTYLTGISNETLDLIRTAIRRRNYKDLHELLGDNQSELLAGTLMNILLETNGCIDIIKALSAWYTASIKYPLIGCFINWRTEDWNRFKYSEWKD
jgi:DNA polymerase III gamma/tau subunit